MAGLSKLYISTQSSSMLSIVYFDAVRCGYGCLVSNWVPSSVFSYLMTNGFWALIALDTRPVENTGS